LPGHFVTGLCRPRMTSRTIRDSMEVATSEQYPGNSRRALRVYHYNK
jgi:hypothetical protein